MSCAASTGIGLLLRARLVVDGRRGRVGPVVASRDRHGAIEGPHVPVDARGPLAPVAAPDRDLPAMILGSLRRVQRPPQRGVGDAIELAVEAAAGVRHRTGVRAQIDDAPGHLSRAQVGRASVEKPMQAEPPHQRPVGEQEIGRHRRPRQLRAALTVLRLLLLTGAGPGRGSGLDAEAREHPAVQREPADQHADDDEGRLHG